jgi:hypothetical protein
MPCGVISGTMMLIGVTQHIYSRQSLMTLEPEKLASFEHIHASI